MLLRASMDLHIWLEKPRAWGTWQTYLDGWWLGLDSITEVWSASDSLCCLLHCLSGCWGHWVSAIATRSSWEHHLLLQILHCLAPCVEFSSISPSSFSYHKWTLPKLQRQLIACQACLLWQSSSVSWRGKDGGWYLRGTQQVSSQAGKQRGENQNSVQIDSCQPGSDLGSLTPGGSSAYLKHCTIWEKVSRQQFL